MLGAIGFKGHMLNGRFHNISIVLLGFGSYVVWLVVMYVDGRLET